MSVRFALPTDITPPVASPKTKSKKMSVKKRAMTSRVDDQAYSQLAHEREHPHRPPQTSTASTSMNTSHSLKVLRDRVVFPRCRQIPDAQPTQRRPSNQPQIFFGTSSRFDGRSIGRAFIESHCALVDDKLRYMAGSSRFDSDAERDAESDSDDDYLSVPTRRSYYGSGNASDQSDTSDEGVDSRRLAEQMHTLRDAWHHALDNWEALQHALAAIPRDVQRTVPVFDFDGTDSESDVDADVSPRSSHSDASSRIDQVRTAHSTLLDTLRNLHALEDEPLTAHLVQARLYSFAMPSAAFVDPSCACTGCDAYASLSARKSVRKPERGDTLVALVCRRADVLARVAAREAERVQMDKLVSMFFKLGPSSSTSPRPAYDGTV